MFEKTASGPGVPKRRRRRSRYRRHRRHRRRRRLLRGVLRTVGYAVRVVGTKVRDGYGPERNGTRNDCNSGVARMPPRARDGAAAAGIAVVGQRHLVGQIAAAAGQVGLANL